MRMKLMVPSYVRVGNEDFVFEEHTWFSNKIRAMMSLM